jgi:hypothetical protein
LVCGVIGTRTATKLPSNTVNSAGDDDRDDNSFTIVPVTDCVQQLQSLQRCLRRDDDVTPDASDQSIIAQLEYCGTEIITTGTGTSSTFDHYNL